MRGLAPRALCRNVNVSSVASCDAASRTIRHYLNKIASVRFDAIKFRLLAARCIFQCFPLATLIRLYEFLKNSRLIDLSRSTPKQPFCKAAFVLIVCACGVVAVSYTHLDVYKRQVKHAYAIALASRCPTVTSVPSNSSVTLWEETAPVKLPTMHCPRSR